MLLVPPPPLAPPLGVQVMSTDPASVVPPDVPGAVQVITTVPDSSFDECPSTVTVKSCAADPLCAVTWPLPVPSLPPPPLPATCHRYVISTEPPDGSPDTENVTVPVGGSVGGQGPLYVLFVMLALAETVTGPLDVEGGPLVPADVLAPEVGGGNPVG